MRIRGWGHRTGLIPARRAAHRRVASHALRLLHVHCSAPQNPAVRTLESEILGEKLAKKRVRFAHKTLTFKVKY